MLERELTTPYQYPPNKLRSWGYPPLIRCCEPKIIHNSAFALCKNSVHLGALTELQDKQSDNVKSSNKESFMHYCSQGG
jgi:hypothetical protein